MKKLRPRLTYSNVVSTVCLFLLVGGGTAFAAAQLGKNSVGAKQLKKNAVTTAKIKKAAVTGAKIKLSSVGTVPSAAVANSLAPVEAIHVIGAPGQPSFENGSSNFTEAGLDLAPAGFYKDHEGIVHLEGAVKVGKNGSASLVPAFTLPVGFRPAPGTLQIGGGGGGETLIAGTNTVLGTESFSGSVAGGKETPALLSGISFLAQG
jgi:hypothetical protein